MLKTQTFTKLSDGLITDWRNLWNQSPYANMTNSPAWTLASLQAFEYKEFAIVTVYDSTGTKLLGIAPFVKTKIYGIPTYTSPALEFSNSPQILVDYTDKIIMNHLFFELAKLNTLYITNLTDDILLCINKYIQNGLTFHYDLNPYIDLSNKTYEANTTNTKLLKIVQNSNNKITIIPVAKNALNAIEKVFTIDVNSSKQKKGKCVFHRKKVRDFYKLLIKYAPESIQISLLIFDKKPVSYSIGFFVNKIHQASQKAYLPDYRIYSPGRLLIANIVHHFQKHQDAIEFDFGRGYDPFKKGFTKTYRQLSNVFIAKNTPVRIYILLAHKISNILYNYISSYPFLYKNYHRIKDILE